MRRRVPPDNTPKITLTNVLKRRRTNLAAYVKESGATSYGSLVESCRRMGVIPPTEDEWRRVAAENVSQPTEGIIVLEPPPPPIAESTGEPAPPLGEPEPEPALDLIPPEEQVAPRRRKRPAPEEEAN